MEETIASKPRVCFEFEVEKVIGVSNDGRYQVQWAPAWVSNFHLVGCEHLIQEFLQRQSEEIKSEPEVQEFLKEQVEKERETEPGSRIGTSNGIGEVSNTRCEGQPDATLLSSLGQTSLEQPICKVEISDEVANIETLHAEGSLEPFPLTDYKNPASSVHRTKSLKGSTSTNRSTLNHLNQAQSSDFDTQPIVKSLSVASSLSIKVEGEEPKVGLDHGEEICVESDPSNECSHLCQDKISDNVGWAERKRGLLSKPINEISETCNEYPISGIHSNNRGSDMLKQASDEHETRPHGKRKLVRNDSDDKPYECVYCSKEFKQSGDLNRHIRIHTGEKPFRCGVCDYSSATKGNLAKHMRYHANEQPFLLIYSNKQ